MRIGARRAKSPIRAPAGHTARQKNRGIHTDSARMVASSAAASQPPGDGVPCHSGRTPVAKPRYRSGIGSSQPRCLAPSAAHVSSLSPTGDRLTGNFSDSANLFAFSAAYHY